MEPRNYHAFLLRLWRESDHDPWRALLEDPHTGERLGFANVGQLFTYLSRQLGEAGEALPTVKRPAEETGPGIC